MGNILGSSISNIIGAFGLGLIFSPANMSFDRSSKIYTAILLALTSFFAVYMLLFQTLGRVGGGVLVATFIIYISSIAWAIYKGIVTPPEDEDDTDLESDLESESGNYAALSAEKLSHSNSGISLRDLETAQPTSPVSTPLSTEAFIVSHLSDESPLPVRKSRKQPPSTTYHIFHLTFAVIALSLSGYILSHSITTLANTLSISNSLLGATLLSFATTLPEKLVAVFSGARSQSGVLVANTAGSNIFLLTLCAGVLFLAGDLESLKVSGVTIFEILWMWGSSVVFFVVVMIGGKKWMGWALLALYLAFIACEFTLERR